MKKVQFYFDFLSPYSYLGWCWVRDNLDKYDWELIPVMLGQIISSNEMKGPAEITNYRNYLFKDCLRYAKIHNIPFTTPENLPFNSTFALRLAIAENTAKLVDQIFRAGWEFGKDIGNIDVLNEISTTDFSDKKYKIQLKQNTEKAIACEIFGLPTFRFDAENFWSVNSLEYLKLRLNDQDPLEYEKFELFLSKHSF